MSQNWSWYISALVVLNIVGCVWLLWWTGKRRPGDPKPEDTSHYWDGDLTEYNKPMPRWWLVLFYATIVFGVAYLVYYPGMGSYAGTSGWTSVKEHDAAKAAGDALVSQALARFAGRSLDDLAKDPEAMAQGQSVFASTCAACHGSDARGAKGFPNLTDASWQWGGDPEAILASVLNGRQAAMPPLAAALGGEAAINETIAYVQSLSGQPVDRSLASAGQARFVVCAACHGMDGKGNALMGAPDLTDEVWLYGGDAASIRDTLMLGRNGMMPAHEPIIGPVRARLAAAWVYGQAARPATETTP